MFWSMMEADYPGRWLKSAGNAVISKPNAERLTVTARRWLDTLKRYERSDISKALHHLSEHRADKQFLPSRGQFAQVAGDFRRQRIEREEMLAREKRLPLKGTRMPEELSNLWRAM